MNFRFPLVPFTVRVNVERRSRKRVTVLALMTVIAVLAIVMGAARIYKRSLDDWAYDRQQAAEHKHESNFSNRMLNDINDYKLQHPLDDKKYWVIHGNAYRVTPQLEQFLDAKAAYHRRQAQRHEEVIGRWWRYVTPESAPASPPVVPIEEAMGR